MKEFRSRFYVTLFYVLKEICYARHKNDMFHYLYVCLPPHMVQPLSTLAIKALIRGGHGPYMISEKLYDELEYIRFRENTPEIELMKTAIKYGKIEWIYKLRKEGIEWEFSSIAIAAENNHIECIRAMREMGCGWDLLAITFAAQNGYIECVRVLKELGCQWEPFITAFAAENNQIECIRELARMGCRWDNLTISWAVRKNHIECVRVLRELGCPWGPCRLYTDDPETIAVLDEMGCPQNGYFFDM